MFKGGEGMYQALYRKWRPKVFDDVIGQEHITETLKTQVRTGHLSHAYIFIGTRGTGKTTCARILAKAVNCENPVNGNPCNNCRFCRGIDDGSILDIVELDAASNTGVDNVRDLREEAVFSPAVAKKRVYIIDEVHMLSLAAFNALLKIIEEPPAHLMFILATTELQKVPATILSRCQRHSFRRIPTDRLSAYLREIAGREKLQLDDAASLQIARLAEGGVRDALSILDQCSSQGHITTETVFDTMGLAGNLNLVQLLKAVLRHDSTKALTLFQKIWLDGKEPASFLGELNGLIRDILIVKAAPAGAGELISGNYERDVLDAFASSMTKEELLYCADTVQEALIRIRQVRNPRIAAEICIVSLCDSRTAESVLSLRARISRLEETIRSGVPIAPGQAGVSPPDREEPETEESFEEFLEDEPEPYDTPPADTGHFEAEEPPARPYETGGAPTPENPPPRFVPPPVTAAEVNKAVMPGKPDEPAQNRNTGGTAADGGNTAELEKTILKQAREKLPIELRFSVEDPAKFRLSIQNRDVNLEAVPGFLLDRLKKPEVRAVFAAAAENVLGHPVAVKLSELSRDQRSVRDLNELKQFKEVTFLS